MQGQLMLHMASGGLVSVARAIRARKLRTGKIQKPLELALKSPEVSPKSAQGRPKVGPKSAQSRPKVAPKLAQSGPKSPKSQPKVDPTSAQSWFRVNLLKGRVDRPQAKTLCCCRGGSNPPAQILVLLLQLSCQAFSKVL